MSNDISWIEWPVVIWARRIFYTIGFFAILWLLLYREGEPVEFYANHLRAPLFQTMLTVGGVLLALQTFIVSNISTAVYDTEEYVEAQSVQEALGDTRPRFAQLRNLNAFLSASVVVSLISALVQYSIGVISAVWAVCLAVEMAFLGICLLFESMCKVVLNIHSMIRYLGERYEKRLKALQQGKEGDSDSKG
ncbi:MAG: hypothetical protein KDB07_08690 [Planctomycetes bacterium]|nr:hypothetical protein [Planctomycetota bacterium]